MIGWLQQETDLTRIVPSEKQEYMGDVWLMDNFPDGFSVRYTSNSIWSIDRIMIDYRYYDQADKYYQQGDSVVSLRAIDSAFNLRFEPEGDIRLLYHGPKKYKDLVKKPTIHKELFELIESHFDAIRKLPKKIMKRLKDCADIHLQQVDSSLQGYAGIVDEHIYARFKRREMYMDLISVQSMMGNTRSVQIVPIYDKGIDLVRKLYRL